MDAFLGYSSMVLLLAALIIYPLYFRTLRRFTDLLESDFSHEWEVLGRPKLNASLNVSSSLALIRYIWLGQYIVVESSLLAALGKRAKILLILGLIVFAALVAVAWLGSK